MSTATASRALRQPEVVAEATRERVAAAVDRLGYIPDIAAGMLASPRSLQVALVVPTFATPAFLGTIRGASDVLRRHGFQPVLADTNLSGDDETALIISLLGRRVDAVIATDLVQAPRARAMLAASGVPVVETWTLSEDAIDLNVGFDNRAAGRAATEHLLDRGRRSLGMICGPLRRNQRGQERSLGFIDAILGAGLGDPLIEELPHPFRWADAEAALLALLRARPELDGVFCSGDSFAAGALFAAQRHGIAVPGRIALIGLGDGEMSERTVPSLSGVAVPGERIGREAAELVVRRLRGETALPRRIDVGFEVMARESS